MIKNKLLLLFTILSALALGACGSSSGGGGGGGGGGGLATGGFTKTVELDGASSSWTGPFRTGTDSQGRYQLLALASDILGSGNIEQIKLKYFGILAANATCTSVTIRMGHTDRPALVDEYSYGATGNGERGQGTMETVLNAASVTMLANAASSYNSVTLGTPFNYNGVDNLLIDIVSSGCNGMPFFSSAPSTAPYNAVLWNSSATATGTDGSLNTDLLDMQFVFAGGDNQLFTLGPSSATAPFTSDVNSQRQQQLYLASELDGSGPITGIGLEMTALTTAQTYTVTVKLGHTTVTTLASDYAANYTGSSSTIASAVTFTVPAGVPATEFVWVPITGSFNYNGTDNLILEFDVSTGSGTTAYGYHNHGSGDTRLIYGPSDASSIIPITTAIHHVKFRFNGGPMAVHQAQSGQSYFLSGTATVEQQFLYPASDLGTAGSINSVACLLWDSSTTVDYPSMQIYMGHTMNTELDANPAVNLALMTQVRNATLNVVTGQLEGDWLVMSLGTPFAYDGTSNLLIQLGSAAGSVPTNTWCKMISGHYLNGGMQVGFSRISNVYSMLFNISK